MKKFSTIIALLGAVAFIWACAHTVNNAVKAAAKDAAANEQWQMNWLARR